ncbi:conserved hypothetical protein [Desulfamplus magnetovallimortis]|uniref:Outer-membrane lipoprotein LolB n=1 Tax=Desulfamplus magnetovallimortis TaxID=1246637 RepID=A0A1W1HDM6_9BACT|nr:hypothetical protein [Desulfamplus magnetovallimortis]SLM30604.1 conserved hypothetical protein [Desulfamplus magnetovallimortis]
MVLRTVFVALLFFIAGCTSFYDSTVVQNGKSLISTLMEQTATLNQGLETCKGTGWITLNDQGQSTRFRMAWAASFPDKIRMTLLSAGHPVETIVADGKSVSLVSHTGAHPFHKIHSGNPELTKVLSIPVTLKDIITIFAGRVPLREYDSVEQIDITYLARGAQDKKHLVTDTMLLLKQDGKSVQKIVFNQAGNVLSYTLKINSVDYTVFHDRLKLVDGYIMPVNARITDGGERSVDLRITNYQPNVSINPDIFVITE